MEEVRIVTMIRWLQVVQPERVNFFVAQVTWFATRFPGVHVELSGEFCCCRLRTSSCCPLQRGTCLSSVHLSSFGGGAFGVGGRGPQALGMRRPQRSGVRGVAKGIF